MRFCIQEKYLPDVRSILKCFSSSLLPFADIYHFESEVSTRHHISSYTE